MTPALAVPVDLASEADCTAALEHFDRAFAWLLLFQSKEGSNSNEMTMIQTSEARGTRQLRNLATVETAVFTEKGAPIYDDAQDAEIPAETDVLTLTYAGGHSQTLKGNDALEAYEELAATRPRRQPANANPRPRAGRPRREPSNVVHVPRPHGHATDAAPAAPPADAPPAAPPNGI